MKKLEIVTDKAKNRNDDHSGYQQDPVDNPDPDLPSLLYICLNHSAR